MNIVTTSKCLLARLCLSLYILATLGLTSLAAPAAEIKGVIFSPYMDLSLPVQAEPATALSGFIGRIRAWVGLPATVYPHGLNALTLAFATGECGAEHWDDKDAQTVADSHIKALRRAGIQYIISTGGAQGMFTCDSEQGMEQFISRYNSNLLLGFDFDIEAGQSEQVISKLMAQIHGAMQRHPHLRFSFTLATSAYLDENQVGLSPQGESVMSAINKAGLANYFINLMVMNYGDANADNCVVEAKRCDMAASAIRSVQNFGNKYAFPLHRIEMTPMIGVNDVTTNIFSLSDALVLAQFAMSNGLGGLHFWSINRDAPCVPGLIDVSPTCSHLADTEHLAFTHAFSMATR